MALLKIAQIGHPVLRTAALAVPLADIGSPKLETLLKDMIETMRDAAGAGLAAPQVYTPLQVCVIEVEKNPRYPEVPRIPLTVLLNPELRPLGLDPDGSLPPGHGISMYEGCLSVPNLRGRVRRPRRVLVSALSPTGERIESVWEGVHASIIQHEVDHLNRTLFVDRADPRTLTTLSEYERSVPSSERILDEGPLPP